MSHQLVAEIHREAARRVRSFETAMDVPSDRFLAALRSPDAHFPRVTPGRRGTARRMPRFYV